MRQEALAKRLGVGLKTIESWENDLSEPRANKLQTLAGVLNVSIPWLLTGEGVGLEPEAEGDVAQDAGEVMSELRLLRTNLLKTAERIGVLEKRLKAVLGQTAEPAE